MRVRTPSRLAREAKTHPPRRRTVSTPDATRPVGADPTRASLRGRDLGLRRRLCRLGCWRTEAQRTDHYTEHLHVFHEAMELLRSGSHCGEQRIVRGVRTGV